MNLMGPARGSLLCWVPLPAQAQGSKRDLLGGDCYCWSDRADGGCGKVYGRGHAMTEVVGPMRTQRAVPSLWKLVGGGWAVGAFLSILAGLGSVGRALS